VTCCLYLMQRTSLVKIGISQDPSQRAHALTCQAGEAIRILHCIEFTTRESALFMERLLHEQFRAFRAEGEWFLDVPGIHQCFADMSADGVAVDPFSLIRDLKTCPRCGYRGPVGPSFGFRNMGDGTYRSQSHCRECRRRKKAGKAVDQLLLPSCAT
jgi:hypothetical protein